MPRWWTSASRMTWPFFRYPVGVCGCGDADAVNAQGDHRIDLHEKWAELGVDCSLPTNPAE
jgi:hypothetical protein